MGTAIKHRVLDRVKPSLVIFDIRALWRSWLTVRVSGCQKLQMTGLTRSGTGCFIAVLIWQQLQGRQMDNSVIVVDSDLSFVPVTFIDLHWPWDDRFLSATLTVCLTGFKITTVRCWRSSSTCDISHPIRSMDYSRTGPTFHCQTLLRSVVPLNSWVSKRSRLCERRSINQ